MIMGNNRPSMLLNFNVNFVTFFETALDAIWLLELILRLEAAIKGYRVTGFVVLLVIHVPLVDKDN